MKYPLSINTWNNKEIKQISKILKSGNYTMGSEVKKFEKKFSKYFGSKYSVMVNSGSSANLLMFSLLRYFKEILKIKTKTPNIIVPAIGWSTSYFPISQNNFKLNFVDVNFKTLNIDEKKIEKSIDKNTVAILAINLLGNPCNFNILKKIAKKNNLILLEDNCESMCATFNKKNCGTFGLMGTHSLFFAHHMQTMEGGVILTDNFEVYNYLKSIRAHGWTRDLNKNSKLNIKNSKSLYDKFTFVAPGYSVRPLEIEAAAGNVQIEKLKKFIDIRRKNSTIFKKLFSNKKWCQIQEEYRFSNSSWYGFNITLKGELEGKREKIINKLIKHKIEVRPTMTGNFVKNPVIKYLDYEVKSSLNSSDYIHENGFFVGNYPKNLKKELEYLFKLIQEETN